MVATGDGGWLLLRTVAEVVVSVLRARCYQWDGVVSGAVGRVISRAHQASCELRFDFL